MKKIYLFIAATVISSGLFAQQNSLSVPASKSKTNAPAQAAKIKKVKGGVHQTAAALWSDDFSVPGNWLINSPAGAASWVIGTTIPSGLFLIDPIASTTAANGFALFDSDLDCSGNQITNLTTKNSVNLTGKAFVKLDFEQYYRRFVDSTFVFVSTDSLTWTKFEVNQGLVDNDFSGGDGTINPHLESVNISSVAGNQPKVWIRFQFFSPSTMGSLAGCGYSWMIDDVAINEIAPYDAEAVPLYPVEFSAYPLQQASIPIKVAVRNLGASVSANQKVFARAFSGTTLIYEDSVVSVAGPNPGQVVEYMMPHNFEPGSAGSFGMEVEVRLSETDGDSSNNFLSGDSVVVVTDTVYARDNGFVEGNLGIGGGITGVLGQTYDISSADTITSISFYLDNPSLGTNTSVSVYNFTTEPNAVLATSNVFAVPAPGFYTLPLSGGLAVTAGKYFVGINELDSILTIGTTSQIFTPGTTWVNFPGNPQGGWANSEDYGFPVTYILRANLGNVVFVGLNNSKALNADVTVYPNPSNTGSVNLAISGPKAADYKVSIIDILGKELRSFNVNGIISTDMKLDMSSYSNGMYFVKVQSSEGAVTRKVTLNK